MTTGMNPSWVLSEEQRKKRFKKYRDPRDGGGGDDTELSPTNSQDSESEIGLGMDRNGNRYGDYKGCPKDDIPMILAE